MFAQSCPLFKRFDGNFKKWFECYITKYIIIVLSAPDSFCSSFLKSHSVCLSRLAVAVHSFSQTKSSVWVTHLTQSVGCPWCLASCKTLFPPIGSPSWWDTQVLQPVLILIACPWCQASCHQKLSAPLSWEARKARSGPHLQHPYIRLRLRLVCYIKGYLMFEPVDKWQHFMHIWPFLNLTWMFSLMYSSLIY